MLPAFYLAAVVYFFCIAATPALAITVNAACREVGGGRTTLLLDLSCKGSEDCWPDPDDVDLVDAATGVSTNWSVTELVWLDAQSRVTEQPKKFPVRAVWDMSANVVLPAGVRLEYDGQALTPNIVPENSCARMPEAALDELRIIPGKP